jgi:hypothetical protein
MAKRSSRPKRQPEVVSGYRYKVTVVSASVSETKADGQPWHTTEPDPAIPFLQSLASLSSMGPIATGLASAVLKDTDAGKARPPSPAVKIQIGGDVFETATRRAEFNPVWNYAFAIDVREFSPASEVVMVVVDDDGDAPIEQVRMNLRELLARPDHSLEVGMVQAFQLKVEPLPDQPSYRVTTFRVPGNERIEDLANLPGPRFEGDWQAIQALNGDVLRVRATGSLVAGALLCTDAIGPSGVLDGGCSSYNRDDFRDLPHGALVGYLAGQPILVGAERVIEVTKAGRLILGVNDKDVGNNTGYFDVHVELNPPDLPRSRRPVPGYVAPAWGAPNPPTETQEAPSQPNGLP